MLLKSTSEDSPRGKVRFSSWSEASTPTSNLSSSAQPRACPELVEGDLVFTSVTSPQLTVSEERALSSWSIARLQPNLKSVIPSAVEGPCVSVDLRGQSPGHWLWLLSSVQPDLRTRSRRTRTQNMRRDHQQEFVRIVFQRVACAYLVEKRNLS